MGIFDSHVHAFSSTWQQKLPPAVRDQWGQIKVLSRGSFERASLWIHKTQSKTRHLPAWLRSITEEVLSPAVLGTGLLFESSLEDLLKSMSSNQVDKALLIAHPDWITNEFVLDIAKNHPEILAAVMIRKSDPNGPTALRKFVEQGAVATKIHAAHDNLDPTSAHAFHVLEESNELGLPVILHTGCIHSHLVNRSPGLSDVRIFSKWFRDFKQVQFILAHTNGPDPQAALEIASQNPNVWLELSWQTPEIIGEAYRRIGSERILFGSDFPFLGNTQEVAIDRARSARKLGWLPKSEFDKFMFKNADSLFRPRSQPGEKK